VNLSNQKLEKIRGAIEVIEEEIKELEQLKTDYLKKLDDVQRTKQLLS
jgi:tetrahydromethanopterin S-methyltransferase subunit B